jgi:PAS domain S-box-containing protein
LQFSREFLLMTPDPSHSSSKAQPTGSLEREESQLWRWLLGFMVLLSFALAALLWERLENIPFSLRAIPIGVLALSLLFAVYAYGRRREVSELKGLLRGLQEHVGAAPSEEQLDQLSQVIMRSQRSFKELIDSFDDPACAVSLDGTLRTVNKRVTEITGLPYSEVVGRKIYDFVEEPTREETERGLGRFLEKKRWAGTVRIRLKNNSRPLYFDCVLNGIVKGDEVVGASMLGRDVTEQREKELRFTELFETLQEGVYFSTPEGQLLDANPALVSILGYTEKRDLLAVEPSALNFDPGQPVLGRAADDRGGVRTREVKLRRKDGTAAVFLDSSRAVTARKLPRSNPGSRHGGTIYVCQLPLPRLAGLPAGRHAGKKDFGSARPFPGSGLALSHDCVWTSGVRGVRVRSATPRRKLADHAGCG